VAKTAFISYASEDESVASTISAYLEQSGVSCWIASRDVRPGADYGAEIIDAIEASASLVLVLSEHANSSEFVKREVERAVSKGKPIFPVRVREVVPSKSLELFISSAEWIDAWQPPIEQYLGRLADSIRSSAKVNASPGMARTAGPLPGPVAPRRDFQRPVMIGLALSSDVRATDPCPRTLSVSRELPMPFSCTCSAQATTESGVWGTDVYTDDSGLCRSALHAGVISSRGGPITVTRSVGRPLYIGTERNGVTSLDYPATPYSMVFKGTAPPPPGPGLCPAIFAVSRELPSPFTCRCSASATHAGAVWGTDIYTDDSSLCRAALHAGSLTSEGGTITVTRAEGRQLYIGTTRNGVTSNDYPATPFSIKFR
jgi:TIR domain/LCCL domain